VNEQNEQQKKNNRTVILIFAMSIIPFCIAWYLSSNATWMGGGTNNGTLITPPITTEFKEFIGYDQFSIENMDEIKGHWVLMNVVPNKACNKVCQFAIHKTKQLRVMMGKDLVRSRRLVLISPTFTDAVETLKWKGEEGKNVAKEDARLLKVKIQPSMLDKLNKITASGISEGMLFLMDPLGNIMMQYEPEFDPYKVKSDLRKLLKISQIG
jgi:hypothetical protein